MQLGKLLRRAAKLGAVTSLAIGAVPGIATALPSDPFDLPQTTAEPPLRVPATAVCTEKVLSNLFTNSYGAPGFGAHSASACPGPWAMVVLGIDVSVSGVQFDRMFDIYLGRVPMLSSSTSEPASELPGAVTHWHIDADVSRFAGMLASGQPITAILNNVNNATYTGQYQVDLTLSFYAAGADAPAAKTPDFIAPLFVAADAPNADRPGNWGDSGYSPLRAEENVFYEQDLTLPQNLLRLYADVYAQGHGACEEFWWADPGQCGVGTPLRQVTLSIDGVLAGFAPVYPVLFTGGGGPGSWNPIPSPRAWHVDPYRLDLTPFAGLLVDGKPHRFKLEVPDAAFSDPGDFWEVGATLLGDTDHGASLTRGALTSAPVADAATETISGGTGTIDVIQFTATRSGSWTGYVEGSAGRVETVVSSTFDMSALSAIALTDSSWHWTTASAVAAGGAAPVTTTVARTYVLRAPPAGGGHFEDVATTTVDGPAPFQSSFDLNLYTLGAVYLNLAQLETYTARDSSGYCYDRSVTASAGYVTSDNLGIGCLLPRPPGAGPSGESAPGDAGTRSAGSAGRFGGALDGALLMVLLVAARWGRSRNAGAARRR